WDALMRVTRIHLEQKRYAAALATCDALVDLAEKLRSGSEMVVSENLRALARRGLVGSSADAELARTFAALESADARGFMAYALATAAEIDLDAGRADSARVHAERALVEATAARRSSERVWSQLILARVLLEAGDRA